MGWPMALRVPAGVRRGDELVQDVARRGVEAVLGDDVPREGLAR